MSLGMQGLLGWDRGTAMLQGCLQCWGEGKVPLPCEHRQLSEGRSSFSCF